jgi:choline dehydrogenase-like flavoprotein
MISDVLWQRPSREEFDVWGTELGNGPTWSFDALEPYYRKAENWTGPPIKSLPGGQKEDHALGNVFGRNGPMQISYNNYYPGLIEESVAAANNLGARTSSNPVSPCFPSNTARSFFFLFEHWHSEGTNSL